MKLSEDKMAEENTEEKKKGGLLKIIMFAAGGLGLIGAGLAIGFLLFGGGPADPSEEIEEIIERKLKEEKLAAEAAEAEASGPIMKESPEIKEYITTYYEFAGTFTTNLRASRKFLQVGIGVSTQYDDTVMQNVEMHQLALRSEILGVISEFSEEEIEGKEGRDTLARAIASALNAMLEEIEQFGGIEKVHFTSFMLQ